MLETIKETLEAVGMPVWYGAARTLTAQDVWDYIVFYRTSLTPSANKTGFVHSYTVAIVCEEYVPDEIVQKVVDGMLSIPGFKMTGGGTYNYTMKPSTDQVVEVLTLDFVKPAKGKRNV